jgi:hypothetical protein
MAQVIDALRSDGAAAFCHTSGQRDLPVRFARHRLDERLLKLGMVTDEARNPTQLQGHAFGLNEEMLRTSLLAVGPPGSGKTRSFALPIVEHLCLQSLANAASVVVIDPKGDDFAIPGWFDIDIDLTNPEGSWGFDLYGGAASAEEAADRLAAALLPPASARTRSSSWTRRATRCTKRSPPCTPPTAPTRRFGNSLPFCAVNGQPCSQFTTACIPRGYWSGTNICWTHERGNGKAARTRPRR